MAVALTIKARDASSLKRAVVELAFSGTYTTGGEAPTNGFLKELAFSKIHMVNFMQAGAGASDGHVAKYDLTNNKVVLMETAAVVDNPLKELTSGASLTGVTMRAEFIGEGNN